MASKRVNKSPLSAREGQVYLDGTLVADATKFNLVFTPDVWEGKCLGEMGTNRRWTGYTITGTIEQWKTNNNYKKKIQEYLKSGATPEFKLQGVCEDKNSDYYDQNKKDTITVVGCVMTGDISLMDLDTDGDVVKESIKFGAKNIA
jgi:hypothetical protein